LPLGAHLCSRSGYGSVPRPSMEAAEENVTKSTVAEQQIELLQGASRALFKFSLALNRSIRGAMGAAVGEQIGQQLPHWGSLLFTCISILAVCVIKSMTKRAMVWDRFDL
jgi:hypothetical protein